MKIGYRTLHANRVEIGRNSRIKNVSKFRPISKTFQIIRAGIEIVEIGRKIEKLSNRNSDGRYWPHFGRKRFANDRARSFKAKFRIEKFGNFRI